MIFINPKTDFAFKKIFGSEQNPEILISFLNSLLYGGQTRITSLEIINPYLAPKIQGIKDTFLDVKAKLTDETTVIIEMQVLNLSGFEKRILYNAAKAYSIQLQPGEDYTLLNPRGLESIPEKMAQVPEIRKAFEVANQANLTREELEALEQREIYIHDQRNAVKLALRQGIEQGIQVGREQGIQESKVEMARKMIGVLDEDTISQITGLSLEEVRRLR
ncbi:Rpn family recombination-promoting nuclease/putative transposase [Coleofasciculus sp. F4-SAH-05]|uniref:Rpn family recombination-promoting nuclease/putative transposase n=1 Tax=Coleofasciculus sp. F4-SAH-05 TaxID=3069525 RepID=UPI0033040ED4